MTIKVTIEVPDAKVGNLLARLDGYKALCEHVPVADEPRKVQKRKYLNGSARLMLKDITRVRKGTLSMRIVKEIEKYEKKHGAGTMPRSDLTAKIEPYSQAPGAAISAAIKHNYIGVT